MAPGKDWMKHAVAPTPVDPSENVTLMNLRSRTGYNVRVQLSRPGEGGEGAWGPPTLMTTDCPGETPSVIPSCPPGLIVLRTQGLSNLIHPMGPCLSHWRLSHSVPWGSLSGTASRTHWTVLTPDLWPQNPPCSHGWRAGMWRALTGCE